MGKKSIKRKANEFRIWRAGESVSWDCTYADIAREIGVTPQYVQKVCKARGWDGKMPSVGERYSEISSFHDAHGVDALMRGARG